jgi:hypothetical protein
MADVSGYLKRKRHHVRGAECVLPLNTKNGVDRSVCCAIFVYQLKSLPPQAVALEIWLAIVEGA